MGSEDHVAGSVGDAVVGVGCTVVKELVDFCVGDLVAAACCVPSLLSE